MEPSRSSHVVGRRRFLAGLAGVLTCAILRVPPGIAEAAVSKVAGTGSDLGPWLTLGRLADVAIGYPVGFPFARPAVPGQFRTVETGVAYVVTYDGLDIHAFANLCTHHGCRVTWDGGRKAFLCPCHRGAFDIDGVNIEGLPQRPLERFETRVRDGLIQIRTARGGERV